MSRWEGNMKVEVGKKQPKNNSFIRKEKKVDSLRLDQKMQPIPWTERPTAALVGAGSL